MMVGAEAGCGPPDALMSTETTRPSTEPAPATPPRGSGGSSFLRSAAESWGSNIVGSAMSLGSVLAVSRALGPSGRGNVAFLTTMAGLTAWAAMLGVPRALANFAPGMRDRLATLAGTALVLTLVSGGLGIAAVALLVAIVPAAGAHISPALRWLALASVPMLVFQGALNQLARSFYGHRVANLMWTVPPATNLVVNVSLAAAGALSVGAALGAWIAGQLLLTLIQLVYVLRRVTGFGAPDAGLGRRMLGFGIRAHAGQVLMAGNYRMDQWIVGSISGSHELGLYSVAVAWSETIFFLPTALQAVLRPDLVRHSPEGARKQATLVLRASQLVTLLTVGALVLLAPFLCTTIFGHAFSGSVVQLRVLALGGFGIAALKLLGDALTSQSKPMLETASIALTFVVVLALDVILIPSHGGLGAAVASAVGYSAGGVAVALIFTRALGGRLIDMVPRGTEIASLVRRARALAGRAR